MFVYASILNENGALWNIILPEVRLASTLLALKQEPEDLALLFAWGPNNDGGESC